MMETKSDKNKSYNSLQDIPTFMVHALETMSINVEVKEDWKENYFKRTKYSKEAIDNLKYFEKADSVFNHIISS